MISRSSRSGLYDRDYEESGRVFFSGYLRPPKSPLFPYTTLFRSVTASPSVNQCGTWNRVCSRLKMCTRDRKSTRLNSSHSQISYAVFCLKKKTGCDVVGVDLDGTAVELARRAGVLSLERNDAALE